MTAVATDGPGWLTLQLLHSGRQEGIGEAPAAGGQLPRYRLQDVAAKAPDGLVGWALAKVGAGSLSRLLCSLSSPPSAIQSAAALLLPADPLAALLAPGLPPLLLQRFPDHNNEEFRGTVEGFEQQGAQSSTRYQIRCGRCPSHRLNNPPCAPDCTPTCS